MKAIFLLFDTLARAALPPYGNTWVQAPNFAKLAGRAVTFDQCRVGSMPCIPARRELHTGRYNFLHRSWGPLEPFDDSAPELLSRAGVYTHCITDHYHYWEDGGATYLGRYNSWEGARGQEVDKWRPALPRPAAPTHAGLWDPHNWANRQALRDERDYPQTQLFDAATGFLRDHAKDDRWFLHLECFSPHPPYFAPPRFHELYPERDYRGPLFEWPKYAALAPEETPELVAHLHRQYAALVSYCDFCLGRVLAAMDEHDLWRDTMLILTTDHGYLHGEHNWWTFCRPPFYDEIAVKPLFVWDPRTARAGARCPHLVQTHDLPATLLEYFGQPRPPDMQGLPLAPAAPCSGRDAALFGIFGGHVNVTDGRYVYMRAPASAENAPLYEYSLMPTHMRARFSPEELRGARLAGPFAFTKGCPVLQTPGRAFMAEAARFGTLLFDTQTDPKQEHPLQDATLEARMIELLRREMAANDAPREQYQRLGLPAPG